VQEVAYLIDTMVCHAIYLRSQGDDPQHLKAMTTYTKTLGSPRFFAASDRVKVTITKAERDAINAANAKLRPITYDGDLFADMFAA